MKNQEQPAPNQSSLSQRERDVLQLAAKGFTDTAIAQKLEIREGTVGTYWGRIRSKLGPCSRTELVAKALQVECEETLAQVRADNARLISEIQGMDPAMRGEERMVLASEVIEKAPDAILVVDEQGTVQIANEAALDLFGCDRQALAGGTVSSLIPERLREVHDVHRAEYMLKPERRRMGNHLVTPALRKDGTEFPIAAALSSFRGPTGPMVICILRQLVQ